MIGTTGASGRRRRGRGPELDLAPDAQTLPVHAEKKGSRAAAVVLSVLSAGAAGGAVALFIAAPLNGTLVKLLVAAAPGLAAVALLLGGAHTWVSHREWDFTPSQVEHRRRGLFGPQEWTEPLSDYAGVLSKQEFHSGTQNTPSYTLYMLFLQHRTNKRRTVKLYQSRSPDGFRARLEHYARLFGLLALIQTADGIEERRPEDLDKSVRERVAEGSLDVTFDPSSAPPGNRLSVRVEGGTLTIRTRGNALGAAAWLIPLLMLVGGVATVVVGLILNVPSRPVLLLAGVLANVVATVALAAVRAVTEELMVSPTEVRKRWRHPWGTFREAAAPANEIEEVVVRTPPQSHGVTTVQAITDATTVHFGIGLPRAEKDWVRDCIIAVISRGP